MIAIRECCPPTPLNLFSLLKNLAACYLSVVLHTWEIGCVSLRLHCIIVKSEYTNKLVSVGVTLGRSNKQSTVKRKPLVLILYEKLTHMIWQPPTANQHCFYYHSITIELIQVYSWPLCV